MDQDREERIRQRAHQLWEEDGRPDGREAEHWERASREIEGGGQGGSRDTGPKPGAKQTAR